MVEAVPFSSVWPHRVEIRRGITWSETWVWLSDRSDVLGVESRDIYTSFSNRLFGFKDPKLAMEFKLRFG